MESLINAVNDVVWSPALVYLTLLSGLYFTVRTRLVQVRQLPAMLRALTQHGGSGEGVSSFQALAMSLAGRVGTGNIAGVATAIAFGGPGAVFWMWIVAFFGASTAFIESTLGQLFKEKDPRTGEYRGGPAYYFEKAYRHTRYRRFFAVYAGIFAVSTVVAMGVFLPGVQAQGIASAMQVAWPGIEPWMTAIGLTVALAFIVVGGVKRIARFAAVVVPFMAILYILVSVVVVFVNASRIGEVITLILSSAFGTHAAFGAILGTAVEWGVKRGIYSNEAGQGTGPHAASAAEVSHPARQGLVQAFSVYVDTLFVCSATAFLILSTGMYRVFESAKKGAGVLAEGHGSLAADAVPGPAFAQGAFDSLVPGAGAAFIAISLLFFAFTTIVATYYMAETNLAYLMRRRTPGLKQRALLRGLQLAVILATVLGALGSSGAAWALADTGVGVMAWINIVGILLLQKPALDCLRDFERQQKAGIDPEFDPSATGTKNCDFWEQRSA